MSLPLTHAGLSAPGISAALDLKFASTLSLTSSSGITPSFSRASTGSYFDSAGVLRYAPFNLLTYSEDFTNGVWLKTNSSISSNAILSPTGTLTADKLVENTAGPTTHVVTYNTATTGTLFSVYAKAGERGWMALQQSNPGRYCYFDLVNGIVGVASGATGSITSAGNGWYRCSILVLSGSSAWDIFISPSDGGAGYTGNGTSGIYIWGAQLEASSTVGTYVPTTSAANSAPRFDHTYNGTSWVSRGLLVEEQRTNTLTYSNTFSNGAWTKVRGTVAQDVTGPDGTTSAWTATCNVTGGGHYALLTPFSGASASGVYTISVFAKKGNNGLVSLQMSDTSSSNYVVGYFDLTNGITSSTSFSGSYSSISNKIENVGNGWYRCSLTATKGTANGITGAVGFSNDSTSGNCTSGQYNYFYNAQLEFGAFATSSIVTTSASVTRSADVCQITGSDFSSFYNASEWSVALEYDQIGQTNNASKSVVLFSISNGSGSYAGYYEDYTGSEYWKNYTTDYSLVVGSTSIGQTNRFAGCVKTNDVAATRNGSSVLTDTSTTMKTGQNNMGIGMVDNQAFWNGHIARLRYFNKRLTDKQLEDLCKPEEQLKLDLKFSENLSLTPVVGPTPSFSRASTGTYFNSSGVLTSAAINAPRFDHTYDGSNWVSRGLLIEEQRTNLFIYSEQFDNIAWNKFDSTISANFDAAPNGASTADKCIPNTANTYHGVYNNTAASISSGVKYTASVYAKASGYNFIFVTGNVNISSTSNGVCVNLLDGSQSNAGASGTYTVVNVGNGWWRISCTATSSSTNGYIEIYPRSIAGTNAPTFAGNGTDGVLIWGAQLESGAFPTSYIPTTSSSVVRSADVCQITGSDFSGFWNQGEGAIVDEYDVIGMASSAFGMAWQADDNTLNNRIVQIGYENSGVSIVNQPGIYVATSGTGQANMYGPTFGINTLKKTGFAWRVNDFALTVDGGAVSADTSGTIPATTQINIGRRISDGYLNGHISRLRYYSIRLPNRLLIAKSQ